MTDAQCADCDHLVLVIEALLIMGDIRPRSTHAVLIVTVRGDFWSAGNVFLGA